MIDNNININEFMIGNKYIILDLVNRVSKISKI